MEQQPLTDAGLAARREYTSDWRKRNAERIREYNRNWRKANSEKLNEYNRNWRKRHPGKTKEYQDRYWNKIAENKAKRGKGTGKR